MANDDAFDALDALYPGLDLFPDPIEGCGSPWPRTNTLSRRPRHTTPRPSKYADVEWHSPHVKVPLPFNAWDRFVVHLRTLKTGASRTITAERQTHCVTERGVVDLGSFEADHRVHLAECAGLIPRKVRGRCRGFMPDDERTVALYVRLRTFGMADFMHRGTVVYSAMETLSVSPFIHRRIADDVEVVVGVEPIIGPGRPGK